MWNVFEIFFAVIYLKTKILMKFKFFLNFVGKRVVNFGFGGGTDGKFLMKTWCEKFLIYFFNILCLKNKNNDEIIVYKLETNFFKN